MVVTKINWDLSVRGSYGREIPFNPDIDYHVRMKLSSIIPHEKSYLRKTRLVVNKMIQGEKIPLISVDYDNTIIDGHHRFLAAISLLKKSATIPVFKRRRYHKYRPKERNSHVKE